MFANDVNLSSKGNKSITESYFVGFKKGHIEIVSFSLVFDSHLGGKKTLEEIRPTGSWKLWLWLN